MVHILGQNHDVVVFKDRRGWEVRYWAERGIIHWEDSRGTSGELTSLREALLRLRNVNVMLGMSSDQGVEIDHQERHALQEFVEKMMGVIRKAKEQGSLKDRLKAAGFPSVDEIPVGKRHTRVKIPHQFFFE